MVRLTICVQHHPARADLLTQLLSALTPAHVLVARDPDPDERPSPLRTYLVALRLAPIWSTHHLVLQDDALPCADFVAAARLAIAARPEGPIAFFAPAQPPEMAYRVRCARDRGETFAELEPRRWAPVVALCWPAALAVGFLDYVEAQGWPHHFRADDEAVGRFLRESGVALLASVPSLVQHPDIAPSLVGRRPRGGRVAARYVGSEDALAIPWA